MEHRSKYSDFTECNYTQTMLPPCVLYNRNNYKIALRWLRKQKHKEFHKQSSTNPPSPCTSSLCGCTKHDSNKARTMQLQWWSSEEQLYAKHPQSADDTFVMDCRSRCSVHLPTPSLEMSEKMKSYVVWGHVTTHQWGGKYSRDNPPTLSPPVPTSVSAKLGLSLVSVWFTAEHWVHFFCALFITKQSWVIHAM